MDDQDDFGLVDFKLVGFDEMFNSYDTSTKKYIITDSTGWTTEVTTQELYEFYIFSDHGIRDSFEDTLKVLDAGLSVTGDDCEFDWTLGTPVRKGSLQIKAKLHTAKPSPDVPKKNGTKCKHTKKYVAKFTTFQYWYCPDCKEDLGDA
jgi:hypothetical protein